MPGHGGFRENAGRKRKLEGQKPKISVTLSKEEIEALDALVKVTGFNRSQLVGRIARLPQTEIMKLIRGS